MMDLLERCLANKCFRMTARVVKWVPVLFVTLLSGWAYYVFVYELCISEAFCPFSRLAYLAPPLSVPSITPSVLIPSVGQRVVLLVIFHMLLIAFLWSYARVIFTPPARPPSKVRPGLSSWPPHLSPSLRHSSLQFYLSPALADELCATDNHYDYENILDQFATDKGLVLANCAHNKGESTAID